MRRYSVILISCILLFSCINNENTDTQIHVDLGDIESDKIYLEKFNPLLPGTAPKAIDSLLISEGKIQIINLDIDNIERFVISDQNNKYIASFYIQPQDTIFLKVISELEFRYDYVLDGTSKYLNEFLSDFTKGNHRIVSKAKRNLDFEDFRNVNDSIKIASINSIYRFHSEHELKPEIMMSLLEACNYQWAYYLLDYLLDFKIGRYYTDENKKKLSVHSADLIIRNLINIDFTSFLPIISFYQARFLQTIGKIIPLYIGNDSELSYKENLERTISFIHNNFAGVKRDVVITMIFYSNMGKIIENNAYGIMMTEYDQIKQNGNITKYLISVYGNYINHLKQILPGLNAPGFKFINNNKDSVRLSDLKGKILYLDFWGTWCTSCIKEIPFSIELYNKIDKDKFEFVYVGFETKNYDVWKKFVKTKNIPGVNLYLEGQFASSTAKDYLINYVPRYILIDENMKIISPYAKRPSQFSDSEEFMSYVYEEINKQNQ